MNTLRITNGRVTDPSQGTDDVTDLWIRGEQIVGLGPQSQLSEAARARSGARGHRRRGQIGVPGALKRIQYPEQISQTQPQPVPAKR